MGMFTGMMVALVTPFQSDGEIDWEALNALVLWHLEEGTQGLIVCGSTGESSTLKTEEKLAIFARVVDLVSGQIPVIAETGYHCTKVSIELTLQAKTLGVDGCLSIVPYGNRPTPEGCLAHYQAIAKVGLPLIVYHHPGRTGVKLSVQTLAELCAIPQVVGIKDCSGDLNLVLDLLQETDKPLFSGDDNLSLPHLACGFKGVISVVGNLIPRSWREFVQLALQGELEKARTRFFELFGLCQALSLEINPQCVKYALSVMGKCQPIYRLPLLEPRQATKNCIEEQLRLSLFTKKQVEV